MHSKLTYKIWYVTSNLRELVQNSIKLINEDPLLFIPDKTKYLYHLSKDNYKKLLTDNITKSYNIFV